MKLREAKVTTRGRCYLRHGIGGEISYQYGGAALVVGGEEDDDEQQQQQQQQQK